MWVGQDQSGRIPSPSGVGGGGENDWTLSINKLINLLKAKGPNGHLHHSKLGLRDMQLC